MARTCWLLSDLFGNYFYSIPDLVPTRSRYHVETSNGNLQKNCQGNVGKYRLIILLIILFTITHLLFRIKKIRISEEETVNNHKPKKVIKKLFIRSLHSTFFIEIEEESEVDILREEIRKRDHTLPDSFSITYINKKINPKLKLNHYFLPDYSHLQISIPLLGGMKTTLSKKKEKEGSKIIPEIIGKPQRSEKTIELEKDVYEGSSDQIGQEELQKEYERKLKKNKKQQEELELLEVKMRSLESQRKKSIKPQQNQTT